MTSTRDEPFFLRFMRELVHHEKTALSNPSQMLQLLTGQEYLHHPFVLVRDRPHGAPKAAASKPTQQNRKALDIVKQLELLREQKACERSVARVSDSDSLWALLSQLEHGEHPQVVTQLLLDVLLGCGRVVDDLRKLTHVKKAIATPGQQLVVLMQAISHTTAAIRAFLPLRIDILPYEVEDLYASLEKCASRGSDVRKVCRRWVKGVASRDDIEQGLLVGRRLRTLSCGSACISFRDGLDASTIAANVARKKHRFFINLARGRGMLWKADFGPRLPDTRIALEDSFRKSLADLACQLRILVDIARGDMYASFHSADTSAILCEAQALAVNIMGSFLQRRRQETLGTCIDDSILQLACMGSFLRPSQQLHDLRVPWPLDSWQLQLLDAVDARAGALVLAPTSAGKTFAAYYAMESVLRVSNVSAVLVMLPTVALAGQVEAEIYARFGQKPYPHDGFELCAAMIPGRSSSRVSRAQIIVAVPDAIGDILRDEALWGRMSWVICDEIHMQPLRVIKSLSTRCGECCSPILAMSATIQHPEQLYARLVDATKKTDLRLLRHNERTVDLLPYRWDSCMSRLEPLHPIVLQGLPAVRNGSVPFMAPTEALRLWEALAIVCPEIAKELAPNHNFKNASQQMITRHEFRTWERRLATCLGSMDETHLAQLFAQVSRQGLVSHAASAPGCLGSHEMVKLLMQLRESEMLPCICFHLSSRQLEQTLLELEEILSFSERAKKQAVSQDREHAQRELRIAWQEECVELRKQLEAAEELARARISSLKIARTSCAEDDERAPDVRENDVEEMCEERDRVKIDVSGDSHVRAASEALRVLEERGPLSQLDLDQEFNFVPHRPQRVHGSEIRMLLAKVESGIKELAVRKNKIWSQAVISAVHRGIALHFDEDGCDWINFAVQMLFRLGYVRIILAGEALGCGINLPCRTSVILDSNITGARLRQMAGRAGRRGLDLSGSTVFIHDLATLQNMHAGASAGKYGAAGSIKRESE